MTPDQLKSIFNTLIKSKSNEVDMESVSILSQNLNFGFFEKRKFKDMINQFQVLEGEAYESKKKELIIMAQQKLEELLSRRNFLKTAGKVAAGVAAASVLGKTGKVFAQDSLYDAELFQNNYRAVINSQEKCFVVYFKPDHGKIIIDEFINYFQRALPYRIPFFEANFKKFDNQEIKKIVEEDILKDVVPAMVFYKNGKMVDQAHGYPNKGAQYEEWVDYFKKLV